MKKIIFVVFIIVFFSLVLCSCGSKSAKPVEREEFHMGTIISEKLYGKNAKKASAEIMDNIARLEKLMTINSPGSEIDKLNEMAGKGNVPLSAEPLLVLKEGLRYAELSKGTFDITIGPIVKAWGVFTENPRVPAEEEINNLKSLVGYRDVYIDESSGSAGLAKQGQIVDLGGIAKGYAGDASVEICRRYNIESAFINLGGNVVAVGSKPDGSPWKIGVQNPRAANGKYIGILNLRDQAAVTSGDYERYFEEGGKRYHHILDPVTGRPSDSGLMSTTIIANKAIDADALSTSTFVMGLDKGMEFIEGLDGIEGIFITTEKKVYITSGLKDIFTFNDESKEFQYVEKR